MKPEDYIKQREEVFAREQPKITVISQHLYNSDKGYFDPLIEKGLVVVSQPIETIP